MAGARILVVDIETSPMLFWGWQTGKQFVSHSQIERESYIMCYAAKFVGENKIYFDAIWKHKYYKKNPFSDKMIAKSVHDLFNSADIILGQNSDRFDIKKINTAFILNGLKPTSPHKTIDTMKISKSNFYFASNSLDYVSTRLGFGGKEKHDGLPLWKRCIFGCKKSQKQMESYNKTDIVRTEQIYLKMRPWHKSHPNLGDYVDDNKRVCPVCKSTKLQRRGSEIIGRSKYYRYQCVSCGHWSRGNKSIEVSKERIISA